MNVSTNGLTETAKSIGRAIYFGLLGVLALILTVVASSPDVAAASIHVAGFDINVGTTIVAGVALLLKAVDRYRHTSDNTDSKGIAPKLLQQ